MSRLRLNLRHASEDLEKIWSFVEENALRAGFDQVQVKRIELAVEEATINIIHHAYGGQGGELELCCTPVQGGIEIRLSDEGPAFNPLEIPGADVVTDIASQKIGGQGIKLIRGMSEGLSYHREGGRNLLALRFLLTSGDGP